ncbi:MAG: hypothetical protein JXQ73_15880 [Phycisphaerae bacterium]|nr:hypothetical protein [Phycisphaerae bacterium]
MTLEEILTAEDLQPIGNIHLARASRDVLTAAGLAGQEDVLAAVESGQSVHVGDALRLVRRIERRIDGQPFVAYLKWYAPASWHRRLAQRFRGRSASGALIELQRIRRLHEIGVSVPTALAFGQGLSFGRFNSFLLLSSMEHWPTLEEIAHSQRFREPLAVPSARRRLIAAVANLARRLHAAGIANPSLYSRHVVVESLDADPIRVGMIDLEDLELDVRITDRVRSADLGALALTLQPSAASLADRARFIRAYAEANRLDAPMRALLREIDRFYQQNKHRRRFRHYTA